METRDFTVDLTPRDDLLIFRADGQVMSISRRRVWSQGTMRIN